MFERRHEKLAPISVFVRRMVASVVMAGILIAVALSIGVIGYHLIAGFDWVDSLLEASMILGGNGTGQFACYDRSKNVRFWICPF